MRQRTRFQGRRCRGFARSSRNRCVALAAVLSAATLGTPACSGDPSTGQSAQDAGDEASTILVTIGIWADVVASVACDGLASVETIIPIGGDPHGYEPSLQDRARMESAALVVANGLKLEEGLGDTLDAAAESGTPMFEFAEGIEIIPLASESGGHGEEEEGHDEHEEEAGHDNHEDEDGQHEEEEHGHEDHEDEDGQHEEEEHGHEDHEDEDGQHEEEEHGHEDHEDEDGQHEEEEHGHGHGGRGDPHVWFDPHRVSEALPKLARVLTTDIDLDAAAVEACLSSYLEELAAVDAEIAANVEQLPAGSRKLVTNHEALGYFADRYGFEVIGTVIPTPASMAQASPAQLERLAEIIEHEEINAIFAENLHSVDDVEALASRVGDVEVVTLYTGSLGPAGSGAETYVGFLRTNTELIVDALG